MASERPLLIPSTRTPCSPSLQSPQSIPFPGFKPISTTNPSSAYTMDRHGSLDRSGSLSTIQEIPQNPRVLYSSSARTSISSRSNRSKAAAGRNSVEEEFADVSLSSLSIDSLNLPRSKQLGSRGGGESEVFSASQKEINEENARFIYLNDPQLTNDRYEFAGNFIKTSKYSVFSFLPRNLFEQFHRVAYIYFLIIAILNQLPQLAVFGRGASLLPLAVVLLVTAIKDAYEDWRRHRSDRIENNRVVEVLAMEDLQFRLKKWKDIRVGEMVRVKTNETLPCDMVLLSTSDPSGVSYVQTINLDGETNLKTRYAKQETLSLAKDGVISTVAVIKCEQPNRNIYGFQANMEFEDGKRLSLGPSNIILRGCELKNTDWAVGVIVYAGQETKVMLNSSGTPSKRSRLETSMNREIICLSLFLIALCTAVSTCFGIWLQGQNDDDLDIMPYFRKKSFDEDGGNYNFYGLWLEILFMFLMSVIVFQIMIPISLYISMELVRLGQAYFMIRDTELYDEASNSRFQCRALNINEDLGQVKYVFSDKTGTLTENKMDFQRACIGGLDYYGRGTSSNEGGADEIAVKVNGEVWKPKMKLKADSELLKLLKSPGETPEKRQAHDYFLALAACNTIVPLPVETREKGVRLIDYQGESPDEQALVYAAAAYGFVLLERTSGHIVIDVQGEKQSAGSIYWVSMNLTVIERECLL